MAQSRKPLVALVGAATAALLLAFVPTQEGEVRQGYVDPIGVVTACVGNTKEAQLGRTYTHEECMVLLDKDLADHAAGVLACSPGLKGKTQQLAAATSFAFNVGVTNYCQSTFRRKLDAEDPTACAELSRWTKAGGKVLPGLVKRRALERAMCEGKLQ